MQSPDPKDGQNSLNESHLNRYKIWTYLDILRINAHLQYEI